MFFEFDGDVGFDEVECSFDLIESLDVSIVVLGYGWMFIDVVMVFVEVCLCLVFFC